MPHAADTSPLCSFGHVARHAELLEAFRGQESALLPFRLSGGTCHRLRTGVYVCAHLDEREQLAAWCGGLLDCVTVLAELGLPVSGHDAVHLRLRRNDGRSSARRRDDPAPIRAHWSRPRTPLPTLAAVRLAARAGGAVDRLRVPAAEALRQALTSCLTPPESMAVLDAALGTAFSAEQLAAVMASTSQRVQRGLRERRLPRDLELALDALARGNTFRP